MSDKGYHNILGKVRDERLSSRLLEEQIQMAVSMGYRRIEVRAYGQHGIGGRLWKANDEPVKIKILGYSGQRVGSFGFPNTHIEVLGPASDDVGWLNGGAEIVVHGNAANGTANGMAQGKVFISGNIGARGMTMTKHNPRFSPPELWVLGSAGDYFGEFMAGGVAVVCGFESQTPENVLGYRPLVGMVGGKVFFRGPHTGFSQVDAKRVPLGDDDLEWLQKNLKLFLNKLGRQELFDELSLPEQWQLLTARTPAEKMRQPRRDMAAFRSEVWEAELGKGGIIGDLMEIDRSPIPLITTDEMRRFVPVWEDKKYTAPCESACPTGIPVHQRWRLIREGRVDEAVDLALAYTPFPASVCGYLCPNLCMADCTRQDGTLAPVDTTRLGKASIDAGVPSLPPLSGKRIAVIGGGASGISVAWQLRQNGHEAVIYDMSPILGGKIATVIPDSRLPRDVVEAELERAAKVLPQVHLQQELTQSDVQELREDYDYIVFAVGAQSPRTLPIPGSDRMIPALTFLAKAKHGNVTVGERVVVIGAGNVGCDAATEASRLGARKITLIDVQEPASFGAERDAAEAVGAVFRWPVFTQKVTDEAVVLRNGEIIPADTIIISIGDQPDLSFMPPEVESDRGFIKVNAHFQTTDPKIFAIGDAVKPGLLTDAIGSGLKAAKAINTLLSGKSPVVQILPMIDQKRVTLEYFDPRIREFESLEHCGGQCASCGACRDCGVCITICPESAISKRELDGDAYEYCVDSSRCIGCGFCAQACPCGVWNLTENEPIGFAPTAG
ncbi:MAG: FAD-dependent oxidoreductase [Deltaproteobacteria bacterium]|nr:FAD-dependent oxidoreductase [Deltaproteobacteria bacterium]